MLALQLFSVFATVAIAQSTTSSAASTSTASATVAAGSDGYSYAGCWNETTGITGTGGARALEDGKMESNDTATVQTCLDYCGASSYQYAGLEYGQECWCSNYLNSLSKQLSDSSCDDPCKGNSSQLCGGSLAITLYNLTGKKGSSSSSSSKSGAAAGGAVAEWRYAVGAGVLALGLSAVL